MDASTKTESAKAFSRNLLILAYAIAGKAVLALALALLTSNYAISEIASMAALLIAVAVLTKASAFRLDPAEVENEGDGVTLLRSTAESIRSIAAPLLGFLLCQSLCQCSQLLIFGLNSSFLFFNGILLGKKISRILCLQSQFLISLLNTLVVALLSLEKRQ